MSKCKECGVDHDHDAYVAGAAFQQILALIAQGAGTLNPDVMIHVIGLLGAMLVRYSSYELDDVLGEIARVGGNEAAIGALHQKMIAAGLVEPETH